MRGDSRDREEGMDIDSVGCLMKTQGVGLLCGHLRGGVTVARPDDSGLLGVQKGQWNRSAALPWQVGQQCPDGMTGWLQPGGAQGLRLQVTKPSRQVHRLQGSRGSGNSWLLR